VLQCQPSASSYVANRRVADVVLYKSSVLYHPALLAFCSVASLLWRLAQVVSFVVNHVKLTLAPGNTPQSHHSLPLHISTVANNNNNSPAMQQPFTASASSDRPSDASAKARFMDGAGSDYEVLTR